MQKKIKNIPAASLRKLARGQRQRSGRDLENLGEREVVISAADRLALSVPELTDEVVSAPPTNFEKFDEQDKILR